MRYGYTILYVEDVKETIVFYEKAFGFEIKFLTPENDYGELISGETTIAFGSIDLGKSNFKDGFTKINKATKPFGVEMAFVSEDIEADYNKAINNGAIEVVPIIEKPWGQKVGYIRDNNGFLIELCTPVKS